MAGITERIEAAERVYADSRRLHAIWADHHETPADLARKRDRLISQGRASPDDKFVYVGWRAPQSSRGN